MIVFSLLLIFLLLTSPLFSLSGAAATTIPSVSLAQLKSQGFRALQSAADGDGDDHADGGGGGGGGGDAKKPKVGVFAVTNLGQSYSKAVDTFLQTAALCLRHVQPEVVAMPDGSQRRTFATEHKLYPECLAEEAMDVIRDTFDLVEQSVVSMLVDMAASVNDTQNLMFYSSGGGGDTEEKRKKKMPLSEAPIKDHIHVYERIAGGSLKQKQKPFMVPFHTDNGLFLLLTPFPGHSLMVRNSENQVVSTESATQQPDTILVLMGNGLTDWLLQHDRSGLREQLFAVAHAVPSKPGPFVRSILARMKVAPDDAVPWSSGTGSKASLTFRQMFVQTRPSGYGGLCLQSDQPATASPKADELLHPWETVMNKTCDQGTAYCWMACLDLPAGCDVQQSECYNSGHEACNTVDNGHPHDPTCSWHCKVSTDQPAATESGKYCDGGGIDMLMDGFGTEGGPHRHCIILFVRAWTLDSRLKFGLACAGVFCLGLLIEVIIAIRRRICRTVRWPRRRWISVLLFGLNIVLGYLAMLVAMTYSLELFSCVILGLIVGHAVFNSQAAITESVDPCCSSAASGKKQDYDCVPLAKTGCHAEDGDHLDGVVLNMDAHRA